MNTRSLWLGALALASLSTGSYAADLGVVTSLDICDELGLTGLTISSDSNCLVITGGVQFEYQFGDYDAKATIASFDTSATSATFNYPDTTGTDPYDSDVDIDAWLQVVATSDTDFGPATATIKLLSNNGDGSADWSVGVDQAWVGIGDTTVLMAGYKSSIFNSGDDAPLSYLGLFHSDNVDSVPDAPGTRGTGVAARTVDATAGGAVLQVTSNLGNGFTASAGLEGLGADEFGAVGPNDPSDDADVTAVGVLAYKGDDVTAHLSVAANPIEQTWRTHAGFTGTWDPITVVGAIATDSDGYWNALGSAAVTIDIFKLAASVEATSASEFGAGGSITATVSEGVTLNFGGRYFTDLVSGERVYQGEAAVSAAVAEKITLTAAIGVVDSTFDPGTPAGGTPPLGTDVYGKAGIAWAPGGGLTASSNVTVTGRGSFQVVTKAAKTIQ